MTPRGKKVLAVILAVGVALPTGLASLALTLLGLLSILHDADAIESSVGVVMLVGSGIGWLICGLTIWGIVSLNRGVNAAASGVTP
jgi:hypothetical protein